MQPTHGMTGNEIRTLFLEFFASRDHLVIPSAPLIPERDPTTLFISAGMHPLKPYFQGVSDPPAPRLASCQKCLRTPDIEEVGRTDRHTTFIEMLGNFAPTGGYFKETAIPLAWELVTGVYKLPQDRLRVTVHPSDKEARTIWPAKTGIRADWVYDNEDNWWAAGATGPCGPDSEIWWDRGREHGCGREDCYPDHCERFLEFWNLVFMQFDAQPDGSLPPLPKPGIDTGMGLERISSILQGVDSVFETDLFAPIVSFIGKSSSEKAQVSERIVADHLRAMTFLVADGVLPGNEGRGYVLRRLIRRAVQHWIHRLQGSVPLAEGIQPVVAAMKPQYPELEDREAYIRQVVTAEAERFQRTLDQGSELFERLAMKYPEVIPGEEAFKLHDTFGFPLDLTRELAAEREIQVDVEGFEAAMAEQRARSRTMSGERWPDLKSLPRSEFTGYTSTAEETSVMAVYKAGEPADEAGEGEQVEVYLNRTPFYAEAGGQVCDTGQVSSAEGRLRVEDTQKPAEGVVAHIGTVEVGRLRAGDDVHAEIDAHRRARIARHHSATHLLHKALRTVLGETAVQRGSYVGPDHTTFDFSFNRALTPAEVRQVGRLVNQQVRAGLPFKESHQPLEQARRSGAMALFGEKYADIVRVVCFGDWTCELCGGTHVSNTAEIGHTVIRSEKSVGAGLRRIDLVAGDAAEEEIERQLERHRSVEGELRAELRAARKQLEKLQEELRQSQVKGQASVSVREARVPLVAETVDAQDLNALRRFADNYLEALGGSGVVAVTGDGQYVIKVSRDLAKEFDANKLKEHFGPGGGSPVLVQGKLDRPSVQAIEALEAALQ